jgi:hypothetical protein
MKVSTENDNNFGYEIITILVDNMSLKGKNIQKRIILESSLKGASYQ